MLDLTCHPTCGWYNESQAPVAFLDDFVNMLNVQLNGVNLEKQDIELSLTAKRQTMIASGLTDFSSAGRKKFGETIAVPKERAQFAVLDAEYDEELEKLERIKKTIELKEEAIKDATKFYDIDNFMRDNLTSARRTELEKMMGNPNHRAAEIKREKALLGLSKEVILDFSSIPTAPSARYSPEASSSSSSPSGTFPFIHRDGTVTHHRRGSVSNRALFGNYL